MSLLDAYGRFLPISAFLLIKSLSYNEYMLENK